MIWYEKSGTDFSIMHATHEADCGEIARCYSETIAKSIVAALQLQLREDPLEINDLQRYCGRSRASDP